jgi:hypothetical protein
VRLTNTGSQPWPTGLHLLAGSQATEQPYLRVPPDDLEPMMPDALPAMAPGEAVDVQVSLPAGDGGRRVAWITLAGPDGPLTSLGSPPLQLAVGGG